jgi:hypothetical protein
MLDTSVVVVVSLVAVTALLREHWNFVVSLYKTCRVTGYGVYVTLTSILTAYVWFFVKGSLFVQRDKVLESAKNDIRTLLGLTSDKPADKDGRKDQIMITHSCRTMFYCIIQGLLDEAKARTGERKIRIATCSVHFGSFFRLLQTLPDAKIEYYEVDLLHKDWRLDDGAIQEKEVKKCDMILCQNLFGVPFLQNALFELGRKHQIPVFEDCVQSGSLFGGYKGHPLADVAVWSGGLDKTPACLGGGLGHFRPTPQGERLYNMARERHEGFAIDSLRDRAVAVGNQSLHVMIARNCFGIISLLGCLAYKLYSRKRHDFVQWYVISLAVRKDKKFTPFQHSTAKFCRQPSVYQLLAIRHGLSLRRLYQRTATHEVWARTYLLSQVPSQYHGKLFPWLIPSVLETHAVNLGISEFTWVVAPTPERRQELCQYLNDHFLITMINTTWESTQKAPTGKAICECLVYLPNLNHLRQHELAYIGRVLTKWCEKVYETPTKSNGIVQNGKARGIASNGEEKKE